MPDCDWLISEATYGGRVHEPQEQAKEHLARVVGETAARGGKVIIPAFAVGRTQEIVYRLDELANEGKLPPIPVYVDSPLAVDVTEILSGMCEAGRILHHLRNNVADPRNTIMIVGYCAPHTLGRRIVERQPEVRIFGESHALRAHVEIMNAYSAHADEPELVEFIGRMDKGRLRKIFLVHGDPSAQLALADALVAAGTVRPEAPARGRSVEL
jgi:metallo-beta-lactamase family protein